MHATVYLTEGRTYRYKSYIFTREPSAITDPADISYLQTVGCLKVNVVHDALGGSSEWVSEATPAKKPGPPVAPKKPGPKPKAVSVSKDTSEDKDDD